MIFSIKIRRCFLIYAKLCVLKLVNKNQQFEIHQIVSSSQSDLIKKVQAMILRFVKSRILR